MSQTARLSTDLAPIKPRHGQQGYVRLFCEVKPETRDQLVAQGHKEGLTLKAVVQEALEFYLDAQT